MAKNLPANAGDIRDASLIPGSGRSLGGGNGNPLQYSCLENPMDRGAWWATGSKESDTTKLLSMHKHDLVTVLAKGNTSNIPWISDDFTTDPTKSEGPPVS